MEVVARWTGRHAGALQQALRMTNEAFADHLGVAVRTVAYWRKNPDIIPRSVMQEALDTTLERAPDRVKAQFVLLANDEQVNKSAARSSGTPTLWRSGADLDGQISPDDEERIEAISAKPSRLDTRAVESLAQVLKSQRHLDDTIGPTAVLQPATVQMGIITRMLREASGPSRDSLARVAAEWMSFVGWLHTAVREDDKALALFGSAEDLADEVGDGVIATVATSFRGYVAQLQGRPRGLIRASAAALATPGAHPTQQVMDMLLTAQGYAEVGERDRARQFLDRAANLAGDAGDPPAAVYWYTEPFFRLNIGLGQLAIGDYRDAVASLVSGLKEIPEDQQNAEWLHEYQAALATARERE